jgi:uncharacterized protein YjdB
MTPADAMTAPDICPTEDRIANVRVEPSDLTLPIGATAQITATLVFPDDGTIRICPPLSVSWRSSNAAIASVSDGTVRAVARGKTYISAHAGGKPDTVLVTVTSQ